MHHPRRRGHRASRGASPCIWAWARHLCRLGSDTWARSPRSRDDLFGCKRYAQPRLDMMNLPDFVRQKNDTVVQKQSEPGRINRFGSDTLDILVASLAASRPKEAVQWVFVWIWESKFQWNTFFQLWNFLGVWYLFPALRLIPFFPAFESWFLVVGYLLFVAVLAVLAVVAVVGVLVAVVVVAVLVVVVVVAVLGLGLGGVVVVVVAVIQFWILNVPLDSWPWPRSCLTILGFPVMGLISMFLPRQDTKNGIQLDPYSPQQDYQIQWFRNKKKDLHFGVPLYHLIFGDHLRSHDLFFQVGWLLFQVSPGPKVVTRMGGFGPPTFDGFQDLHHLLRFDGSLHLRHRGDFFGALRLVAALWFELNGCGVYQKQLDGLKIKHFKTKHAKIDFVLSQQWHN